MIQRNTRGCALALCLLFLAVCFLPAVSRAQGPQQKVLAGFFEEWSIYYANYNIADLQANGVAGHLSHFVYAFANVTTNPTPSCVIADAWADFETPNLPPTGGIASQWPLYGNFAEILKLKQLNPNLKSVISLGGASTANTSAFVAAASTPAGRSALAASCIDMFVVGNVGSDWNGNITAPGLFDGFNIDWEFPTASDKQNYTLLLQEFRKQLSALSQTTGKQYVLTADSPAGSQNYVNIELSKVAKVLDFYTIDGYNYAGSWDTVTNHASPVFDSPRDPDYGQGLDIEDTISAYLKAGVPGKKIVLGVPLYGAGWQGVPGTNNGLYQTSTGPAASPTGDTLATDGVATYNTLQGLPGFTKTFDWRCWAISIYNPSTQTFWTYDDPTTARLKMSYIQLRVPGGLGGAFAWALKDDDPNGTMMKTMATGLGR
jgi:chitinase